MSVEQTAKPILMDQLDLKPKSAQKLFEGEGGSYYSWPTSESPFLGQANVGAGWLLLQPRGFALPHYADCSKIGYVIQGSDGVVGMILPNTSKEVILKLKKGDVIPVPLGAISWWFNNGDSELVIVFLGETNKAITPGEFTYFFLSGTQGILGGFSNEFTSKAFDINKDEAKKLVKSQSGVLIIKLEANKTMPNPNEDRTKEMICSVDDVVLTQGSFTFVGQVGLSATNYLKLEANDMNSLVYNADGSVQVIYVVSGDGWIQIVGSSGKNVVDSEVKAGQLIVVPKFFVIAINAGGDGIECFSIITSSLPAMENLASKKSVLEALSPQVLEASFNIDADFGELLISKIKKNSKKA